MNNTELKGKLLQASKWSTITEIAAKLIVPVSNMVLARILVPEAFGVVATVTMIFSFADMFTDAGFQKYLIQRKFSSDDEKYKTTNVAFWTNLGLSILLWALVVLFCKQIAVLVGNPGLGKVIAIACAQLPLTSFSSIQMALYRRDLDFKTLFLVRIVSVCIPFVVSIPLALLGFSYWSIIIGTMSSQLFNAIVLTAKSEWKPKFYYSITVLKAMLSFSIWSLIEAVSIWFTTWADTLIIGNILSSYDLGLYKTSTTMVTSFLAVITSATVPVLFSGLSRLQNDNEQFNQMFLKMQRIVSLIVFPLGVGMFLFSKLATDILLGSQWSEASRIVGQWALTSTITIVLGNYCSEVYRAKGRPKLSFLAQVLHLIVLIPVCIISAEIGFWLLVYARSWIRLQSSMVHILIMKYAIGIPMMKMIRNVRYTAVSAMAMGCGGFLLLRINNGVLWSLISIIICVLCYFGFLSLFSSMRKELLSFLKQVLMNKKSSKHPKVSVELGK